MRNIPIQNKIKAPSNDLQGTTDSNDATTLVTFALSKIDLILDKNKLVYAIDKKTREIRYLNSNQFHEWLTASFYENRRRVVRKQAINEALATLTGIGRNKNTFNEIFRRVAVSSGAYYLDLCQPGNSKAIKITPGCWEVIESPSVKFIRHDNMQSLPIPIKNTGYQLQPLWEICNLPDDKRILIITYLIECLRPDTPYPLLEILGEQGSAKSTTQAILKRIIDPSSCDLRATPKSPEDLFVAAGSNHLISYENVSQLTPAIQDSFCTIATGGGFAKRKLYCDNDEVIIHANNPVMINGISAVVTAPDLIDRTITIDLPLVTNRKESIILRDEFDKSHSVILGALLNIFSSALAKLPSIELPQHERPRLIEFAQLGTAITEILNDPKYHFMNAFNQSRFDAIERTMDENPLITALLTWYEIKGRVVIELPLNELLGELKIYLNKSRDSVSMTTKAFGNYLRRNAPVLRQLGINVKSMGKRGAFVRWQLSPCESQLKSCLECLDVF